MKRKICVVTGTRSEYGLLAPLMRELKSQAGCELQVIATCMHLSPEFGLTYKQIEADGFKIDKKVEMLLSADTPTSISKSMGLCMIGMADALEDLKPDVVVLLGDRFEALATAAAASTQRIPIAHLHGGEITEGAIDDAFRHSISKMSYWHFASTESHRDRVIRLGEDPARVFNTGAIAVDNIKGMKLLSRTEVETAIGMALSSNTYMVTFHPVTHEKAPAADQFKELLSALDEKLAQDPNCKVIFTKPNADTDGRALLPLIDQWVAKHETRAVAHTSLGALRYLSSLQFVKAVVGNSSSGVIEAPYFGIPTIDIGDRQKGRARPISVINCEPTKSSIAKALAKAEDVSFLNSLKGMDLPYGNGGTAAEIAKKLLTLALPKDLKKAFYEAAH